MKSYKEYLLEKISSIVYHGTSINSAIQILKNDEFRLSAAIGTKSESEINKGKFYFLSTARSPMSSYIGKDPYIGNVYFKLDGDKLNSNYKGSPVDYYGPSFRDTNNEMEDRIFSNNQYINDASKYILEIHLLLSFEKQSTSIFGEPQTITYKLEDTQLKKVQTLYTLSKKFKIPLYAYDNINTYQTSNKKRSLNLMDILKSEGVFRLPSDNQGYNLDQYGKRKPIFRYYLELLELPFDKNKYDDPLEQAKSKLSDRAYKLLSNIVYDTFGEATKILSADIHNTKSSPTISKLVDVMKKYKLKNPEDIIDFIKNKYQVGAN